MRYIIETLKFSKTGKKLLPGNPSKYLLGTDSAVLIKSLKGANFKMELPDLLPVSVLVEWYKTKMHISRRNTGLTPLDPILCHAGIREGCRIKHQHNPNFIAGGYVWSFMVSVFCMLK